MWPALSRTNPEPSACCGGDWNWPPKLDGEPLIVEVIWTTPGRHAARTPARVPGRNEGDAGKTFDVKGVKSPLVGRTEQLNVLRDVVKRAVEFQAPQLVTVVGNQGTGKSRLAQWLCERADEIGVAQPLRATHQPVPGPRDGLGGLLDDPGFTTVTNDASGDVTVYQYNDAGEMVGVTDATRNSLTRPWAADRCRSPARNAFQAAFSRIPARETEPPPPAAAQRSRTRS